MMISHEACRYDKKSTFTGSEDVICGFGVCVHNLEINKATNMDMHAYESDDGDDTLSLSDLHIYSDPSSSSEEESDNRTSLSSFRFTFVGSPRPEKVNLFGNMIFVPENDLKPHRKPQKPSSLKTFPVQGNGSCCDDSLVPAVKPRRKSGGGFLMFGLGKSSKRMELCDLRSRQARGSPARIFPVNGGGKEEATARRRSGNWSEKLFGACIPTL
ncbi:hypothetical protein LXL04_012513 [Taraxacum kok-saghyz]